MTRQIEVPAEEIKRMPIKEFREQGYLQEANRMFFHVLGLALEVVVDHETGEESLGGIWDYRDDPEGNIFGDFDNESIRKSKNIEAQWKEKSQGRLKRFGWVIQPANPDRITKILDEFENADCHSGDA